MYYGPVMTLFTNFNRLPVQKKGARGMSRKTNASRYRIAVIGKGIYRPRFE